jgi:hypothetical protein
MMHPPPPSKKRVFLLPTLPHFKITIIKNLLLLIVDYFFQYITKHTIIKTYLPYIELTPPTKHIPIILLYNDYVITQVLLLIISSSSKKYHHQ